MINNQQTLANNLQTLANKSQQQANFLPTTRKSQMAWLATLTAITLIGQYVLLGLTGLGESRANLPSWFTEFELILWGMRGLVEIAVVVYIGMTTTEEKRQMRTLWAFEIVLIGLIVLTVGPIWGASALSVSIQTILGWWGVVGWGALLAGISATMLAGVAYAYKVEPVSRDYVVLALDDYNAMLATVEQAETEKIKALADAGQALEAQRKAESEREKALIEVDATRRTVAVMQFLPGSVLVRLIAMFTSDYPEPATLAEAFNLTESTVRGAIANAKRIDG